MNDNSIVRIKSKNDINGNPYCLEIDTDNKTVKSGYYLFAWGNFATVPNKKTAKDIKAEFLKAGFTEITD